MKTLSIQRPHPCMEIRIRAAESPPVHATLVNRMPLSELSDELRIVLRSPAAVFAQTVAERRHAERDIHRFDDPQASIAPARQVNNYHQIDETLSDGDVGDVGRPDVIDALIVRLRRRNR
ncbi:hypothetical protein ABIA45_007253 [Bradyrhizobium sp. USDA 336]